MKKVSLVLSSGGARGYAHIGAIEALEAAGYEIASVAGTSMGALIGGMYAAGRLQEVKEWMCGIGHKEMFSLTDWSLSLNHIVKGNRVMDALQELVPDVRIEELPIPFCAVATDLETRLEVAFRKGSLFRAIRSSISIPTVFKPVSIGPHTLVDGGLVNPLPLNRVKRHPDDLLVSVNVGAPSTPEAAALRQRDSEEREGRMSRWLERIMPEAMRRGLDANVVNLLLDAFDIMIQRNSILAQKITPPDISVDIPINRFGLFDFDRAADIIEAGRTAMNEALQRAECPE